jgi:hypothetical protein
MLEYQPLVARVAIPGGPLKACCVNGLRCKPACGAVHTYQWLARLPVNQTGDFKSCGVCAFSTG